MTVKYVPEKFNPKRGKYEPIFPERTPKNASPGYPNWVCKNACYDRGERRRIFPENTKLKKCPHCHAPLIRWLKYEVKE